MTNRPTGSNDAVGLGPDRDAAGDIAQADTGNALLRALDAGDYARLAPHLARVVLPVRTTLAEAGAPIQAAYFIERGVAACLQASADGRPLAVGLIGRDGVVGWPVLLGEDSWPFDVVMRVEAGIALCLPASALREAAEASATLRRGLLRFVAGFVRQMARTASANMIQPIDRRTARWLMLCHDRVDGDQIVMTHEELSVMLGVRRASVTDALHALEGTGAIRSLRGRLQVRDRAALTLLAGADALTALPLAPPRG